MTNYTLARKQPPRGCILGHTHQHQHTLHLPGTQTNSWWCISGHTHQHQRLNVCACAVRSCYITMRDNNKKNNTTHKHFTSLCPGLRTKISPPKKPSSSLQNHKIQTAAIQIKRRDEHPGTQTARQTPRQANNQLSGAFWDTPTNTNTHYTSLARKQTAGGAFWDTPTNTNTHYTSLARKQTAGGAFRDKHTNTNTHYTASSSIQAPFGCPANPALVVSVACCGCLL